MGHLDPVKLNAKGNTGEWYCDYCEIRNDRHNADCPNKGKMLVTRKEIVGQNTAICPRYCKRCGCTYSNGCPEHTTTDQVKLAK